MATLSSGGRRETCSSPAFGDTIETRKVERPGAGGSLGRSLPQGANFRFSSPASLSMDWTHLIFMLLSPLCAARRKPNALMKAGERDVSCVHSLPRGWPSGGAVTVDSAAS